MSDEFEASNPILQNSRPLAFGLVALVLWFAIAWPVYIAIDTDGVLKSHPELSYLMADFVVVAPLAAITAIGFFQQRRWAPVILLIAIGAASYDALHFFSYPIQEEFLSIPTP